MNDKNRLSRVDKTSVKSLEDFVQYLSSPWRIMWINFLAGIFRGLGALVGATVMIALLIWLLGIFVDIPVIGEHAADFKQSIINYMNDTDYNEEFDRLGTSLENIEKKLKPLEN